MAVASQLTSLEDFNGAPTLPGYGGGAGAGVNNDIIIEGVQSAGRRVDNTTDKGFGASFTAADLSAAGEHIKVWVSVTQWAEVTQLQVRISSGADDDHELPTAEYPPLGGFIPVWVDVSRTPEVGGSANEASISEIGVLLDIGDVGGNADNLILDEIMHGTSGLRWTGASGTLADFRTYEEANREGNLVTINGADFVYSRLELGDGATATDFVAENATLLFPDQALVADTFMGVTIDGVSGDSYTFRNITISSADVEGATKRPDFVVLGIAGTVDIEDGTALLGMRVVDLHTQTNVTGGIIDAVEILQQNADISGATLRSRGTAGSALITSPLFGSTQFLREVDFVQVGLGHAMEITTPGTYDLNDITFSGYGADGTTAAAIYNNSGGAVTLNVNGGDVPTIRNGTGASTTVQQTVTLTFEPLVANSALTVAREDDQTVLYDDAPTGTTSAYSYNAATLGGVLVNLVVIIAGQEPFERQFNLPSTSQSFNVAQATDANFNDPP